MADEKPVCGSESDGAEYDFPLHVAAVCMSTPRIAELPAANVLSHRLCCQYLWRWLPSRSEEGEVDEDSASAVFLLQAFRYWCTDRHRFRSCTSFDAATVTMV